MFSSLGDLPWYYYVLALFLTISLGFGIYALVEEKKKKHPDGPTPPGPPGPPGPPHGKTSPLIGFDTPIVLVQLTDSLSDFGQVAQLVPQGLASKDEVLKFFDEDEMVPGWIADGYVLGASSTKVSTCPQGDTCLGRASYAYVDKRLPKAGRIEIFFENQMIVALSSQAGPALSYMPVDQSTNPNFVTLLAQVRQDTPDFTELIFIRNDGTGTLVANPDAPPIGPLKASTLPPSATHYFYDKKYKFLLQGSLKGSPMGTISATNNMVLGGNPQKMTLALDVQPIFPLQEKKKRASSMPVPPVAPRFL